MKLTYEPREVTSSGVQASRSFSMKMDGNAFRLMATSLYSDKPLAVVREYCTNACDAHIEAGNPDPIEIHLPTVLEPHFSVKDNGIGLSRDDVLTLFSTYFESTKRDSNSKNGCFGLGSKAAFAYTEAFTINSRFNGKLLNFAAAIGEEGVPTMSLLSERDTTERNGVEIVVPVNFGADRHSFQNAAAKVLPWLTRPVTVNIGTLTTARPETILEADDGSWFLTENNAAEGRVNVLMGGVMYPVDTSKLRDTLDNMYEFPNVFLVIDNGDVSLATTRESLSYDKRTIENLQVYYDAFKEQYAGKLNEKVSECDTYADAVRYVKKNFQTLYRRLDFFYKGEKIEWMISVPTVWDDIEITQKQSGRKRLSESKTYGTFTVDTWVIEDEPRLKESIIEHISNTVGRWESAVVCKKPGKKTCLSADEIEAIKFFYAPLTIILTSSFPERVKTTKASAARVKGVWNVITGDRQEVDLTTDTGYFIYRDGGGRCRMDSYAQIDGTRRSTLMLYASHVGITNLFLVGKREMARMVKGGSIKQITSKEILKMAEDRVIQDPRAVTALAVRKSDMAAYVDEFVSIKANPATFFSKGMADLGINSKTASLDSTLLGSMLSDSMSKAVASQVTKINRFVKDVFCRYRMLVHVTTGYGSTRGTPQFRRDLDEYINSIG